MMSLQDITCGVETAESFNEYPEISNFKKKEEIEAEYGLGAVNVEMDDIIMDHPIRLPYYLGLLRKN